MRSQNQECLNATKKAWDVPFPVIWQAFWLSVLIALFNFIAKCLRHYGGATPSLPKQAICSAHWQYSMTSYLFISMTQGIIAQVPVFVSKQTTYVAILKKENIAVL